jgi:DNA modification methylase
MEYEKGITYTEHWENVKAVLEEASRVLVPGGIMAINVDDIHNYKGDKGKNDFSQIQLVGHKYQSYLRRHQVYLKDQIIWVKQTNAHSRDISKILTDRTPHTSYRILISQEPVYIFRKKGERQIPSEQISLNSRITKEEWSQWAPGVWIIDHVRKSQGHPAIFPDELVYRLVRMFSYEGDTVLDPFLGSGTTIKVARALGREAIGYEREIQYKPVIMEKLGVSEKDIKPESIVGYADGLMNKESVSQDEEAAVTAKFFEREETAAEVESVD